MSRHVGLATLLALVVISGCQPPPDGGAASTDVGVVHVALSSVPTNGLCVRFTTTAGMRTIQQNVDGVSGMPLNAALTGLPYGQALTISADAFGTSCAMLTTASLATYISDVQTVTLSAGETRMLTFTLLPVGNVGGAVDFLYITMTPMAFNFSNIVIGQQGPVATFQVKNIGMVPTAGLTPSITMTTGNTGEFNFPMPTTCPAALPPGATCIVQVRMSPMVAGPKNGTLTVSAAQGGKQTAMLSGMGWNPAHLTITPSADLGSVPLNTPGATMADLTVTNTGDQPTGPFNPMVTSGEFQPMPQCPGVLQGLQSCHIFVRFTPSMTGARAATLTINAAPGGMATSSLTGTGISPLTISPLMVNLGAAPVGMAGPSQIFTVRNIGVPPSPPLSIVVTPAAFKVTSDLCSAKSLMMSGTCTVTVQLLPSAGGPVMGSITANAAVGWSVGTTLQGTGL